ncbi:hypothetical protein U1Q18_048559 [Sarracenia purpurea var. burkii]
MDFSSQYQQQAQDPSGVQSYDEYTQAYYAYHQFNQYQQYPYYAQDYTRASQEHASIHPPGVPYYSQSVADQQSLQQHQQFNSSHSAAALPQMTQFGGNMEAAQMGMMVTPEQQWQGNSGGFGPVTMHQQIGQTTHTGGGRRGGRPFRGGGPRHFGSRPNGSGPPFRGRGRGRGRGGGSSQIPGEPLQHFVPPPRMAWCELCRVDCNTSEILEQHKNGKRHKKNLQVYEELQKLADQKVNGKLNEQIPAAEAKQELPIQSEKAEDKQIQTNQNKVEFEQQKISGEVEVEQTEELARNRGMDNFAGRGRGLKRKMRGGRGGKWMRTGEGSRRPIEPPKPKQAIIPLICELCNVKCESKVVFDSHLTGKKHISNLTRFQGQQAMLEQAALQALYPALQALYPALQALYPPNPNASTSSSGPQFHQENVHGPQGLFPQLAPSMAETTSQAETTDAAAMEAKSAQKPVSPKPEAEPAAEAKSE